MRKHRRTQSTVSNNFHNDKTRDHEPRNDNFDPADALEGLHASILRVETLVQLARHAADELRCPTSPKDRRAFTRMQILIGKAAEEASAVLAEGDNLMTELASYRETSR